MRIQTALVLTGLSLGLASGCTKSADFLYEHPAPIIRTQTQKVRDVVGNSNVDIFWAIGGMTEQQSNFNAGVSSFMTTFLAKNYSWRMAVCSSNAYQPPTIGMPTVFDNSDPNPTNNFVNSVMQALNGDDEEQIFDPVHTFLTQYPNFIRPNATLVLILTNDDADHSTNYTSAAQMLPFLVSLKGGDQSKVIVYGIFGSVDTGCNINQIDSGWNYHGSEFETLINQTGGKDYSLCNASFGTQLASLGDDLYHKIDSPKIVLTLRPIPSTIQVFFQGSPLPGGPEASGGIWYYDYTANAVVFYNLDFSTNGTEQVTVQFTEDTGYR